MRNILLIIFAAFITAGIFTSCIEDGYTTSPAHQPTFSVDTLDMGQFFTEDVTPTFSFLVYNRHDKIMNISSISFRDGGTGLFRLNVDGSPGRDFSNVDIRPNDSIFVFVEATLPLNGSSLPVDFEEKIDFVTNGVTQSVVLTAKGQDAERRRGLVIDRDTRFTADLPYRIYDSLIVAEGVTLTLDPGVKLYFHDKAAMRVDGTLVSLGDAERPVEMSGDRTDNVVGSIPFDLMSGQWGGIVFSPSSRGNRMSHTVVRNTTYGVVVDSLGTDTEEPGLYMLNCRLRNSAGYALASLHSKVVAVGCEIADASAGVMYISGGDLVFNHCTVANYYLFTALGGPAVQFDHFSADTDDGSGLPLMRADFSNCIFYGNGTDLSCGDFTGTSVMIRNCLLKSAGEDDDNFISCLWDTDPMYYTVREDYLFDYRLRDESPAIGAANPVLTLPDAATDYYGIPRSSRPDLGAYVYTPSAKR